MRSLAWTLEQEPKVAPPIGPRMLHFIADAILSELNDLEMAVERLQAAPGGAA